MGSCMKQIISLHGDASNPAKCSERIEHAFSLGHWVDLSNSTGEKVFISVNRLPEGPGIIISSSGSTGGPTKCIQPCKNMTLSALATAEWLIEQGIQPEKCQIMNGLPISHVSGLMPWWRSKSWDANHLWLNPALMRSPFELEKYCKSFFVNNCRPLITSLVPTQLKRLLEHPAGVKWLRHFSVVWIGGAPLPHQLAMIARRERIHLAPCYGSSETMAMVTALSPHDFLQGRTDCGTPLRDVDLRIGEKQALEIRTPRLAKYIWKNEKLQIIDNKDGWWKSGDSAELIKENNQTRVKIIGRIDNAIHSGGETIFPEKLQEQLLQEALTHQIPIESLILVGTNHEVWGERLVALVKLNRSCKESQSSYIFSELQKLVAEWHPAEKPIAWYKCQELAANTLGKWNLKHWREWIKTKAPIIHQQGRNNSIDCK